MTLEQYMEIYQEKLINLFREAEAATSKENYHLCFFHNVCLRSARIAILICEGADLEKAPEFKPVLELLEKLVDLEKEEEHQTTCFYCKKPMH